MDKMKKIIFGVASVVLLGVGYLVLDVTDAEYREFERWGSDCPAVKKLERKQDIMSEKKAKISRFTYYRARILHQECGYKSLRVSE